MKRFRCVIFLFVMFFLGLMAVSGASATTYQEEVNIRFTFDQTLSVDLSSTSLAISSLAPGTTGTSSPIDVTVNTNNIGGYTLTASVGDASHNTTSLTRADGVSAAFTNIARDANLTALSTDNTWGYSVDAGAHFFGLPLYSDAESLILKETDGAVEDNTVSFLIGAKAGVSQPLGDYSNVVNFKAVAKVYNPMRTFQETEYAEYATLLPYAGDTMEIMDSRDGEIYTIGRLADGNVWLLDNLRLDLTTVGELTSSNTNIPYSRRVPSDYTNQIYWYQAHVDIKDSTLSYGSNEGKVGGYYNFCSASAETFCLTNSTGDTYRGDICPKGWRLPTGGAGGEYQVLYGAYHNNITNFRNAFRATLSGYYTFSNNDGNWRLVPMLGYDSSGYFLSSTYYDDDSGLKRYILNINDSAVDTQDTLDILYIAGSVRCMLYDGSPSDVPTLQDVTDSWLAEHTRSGNWAYLRDARGEDWDTWAYYNVARLQDGKYWFMDDFTTLSNSWDSISNSAPENSGYILRSSYDDYSADGYANPYWDDVTQPDGHIGYTKFNYCAISAGTVCNEGTEADSMYEFYRYMASPSDGRCSMFEEWYGSMCEGGEGGGEWGGGEGGGYYDEWGNWIEEGGGEWGGGEGGEWGGGEGDCGWCETNWELQENYLEPEYDITTASMQNIDPGAWSDICPAGWYLPSAEDYVGLYNSYGSDSDYLRALHYTSPWNGDDIFWTSDVMVYSLAWYGNFKNGYTPPFGSYEAFDPWSYLYGSPMRSEAGIVDITSPSHDGEYSVMTADRSELHRVRCMRW